MDVRIRQGLISLALCGSVAACGSVGQSMVTTPTATASTPAPPSTSPSTPTTVITAPATPDADAIARILLAIPVRERPAFLDPYGAAIHGSHLGLGPDLRIAGYRADPLFVCIQHVDMRAGTAGAWTAYAQTATGSKKSRGSGGQCPPAPGRTRVLE